MDSGTYKPCVFWTIFLACVSLGISISVDDCPEGVKKDNYYLKVDGLVCYRFELENELDYDDAETECKRDGGHLAMPKNSVVSNFLYNKLTRDYRYEGKVWIGLNDKEEEGEYTYVDGIKLDEGSYSNWAKGTGPQRTYAKRKTRDCVTLDTEENGKWVDTFCSDGFFAGKSRYYVCQYNVPERAPQPPGGRGDFKGQYGRSESEERAPLLPGERGDFAGQYGRRESDDRRPNGRFKRSKGVAYYNRERPSERNGDDEKRSGEEDNYAIDNRSSRRNGYVADSRSGRRNYHAEDNRSGRREDYADDERHGRRDDYAEDNRSGKWDDHVEDNRSGKRDQYAEEDRSGRRGDYAEDNRSGRRGDFAEDKKSGRRPNYRTDERSGSRDDYTAPIKSSRRDDYTGSNTSDRKDDSYVTGKPGGGDNNANWKATDWYDGKGDDRTWESYGGRDHNMG